MSRFTRILLVVGVATALIIPVAAIASDRFVDVPDDNVFHDDIGWLADARVTIGCNPPVNDEYCPSDFVSRQQMAAFMRRLANNQVVDAATVQGYDPAEITNLSGMNSADPVELPADEPTTVLTSEPLMAEGEAVAQVSYSVAAANAGAVEPAEIFAWLQMDDDTCDPDAAAIEGTTVGASAAAEETVTVGSTYLLMFEEEATVTLCAVSEGEDAATFQAALNFVGSATTN